MLQPESGILDDVSSSEPSPESVWDEHWRQQQMLEALRRVEQRLGEQSRRVFQRIARDRQPSQTVADELGISPNQVYKTRQRALAMLREELEFVRVNPLTSS